VSITKNTFSS